jgi:NADH-quinone oxidoreductase subunit L
MFRLLYLTFYGEPRARRLYDHAHEPPASMRIPLIILALLAAVGGWIGVPHAIGNPLGHLPNLLQEWLEPVFAGAGPLRGPAMAETADLAAEYGLMAASVGVALLGIGLATYFYRRRPELPARIAATFPAAHRLLERKYYVDEIYGALVVRPYLALCAFCWRIVDEILIDGFVVKAVGGAVGFYSRVVARLQTGLVQNYAAAFFVGVVLLLGWYLLR